MDPKWYPQIIKYGRAGAILLCGIVPAAVLLLMTVIVSLGGGVMMVVLVGLQGFALLALWNLAFKFNDLARPYHVTAAGLLCGLAVVALMREPAQAFGLLYLAVGPVIIAALGLGLYGVDVFRQASSGGASGSS